MCAPDLCFEKKMENITIFHLTITIFTAVKNRSILHRRIIVMNSTPYTCGLNCLVKLRLSDHTALVSNQIRIKYVNSRSTSHVWCSIS